MDTVVIVLLALHVLLSLVYAWDWFGSFGRLQEAAVRLVIGLMLPLVGVLTLKLVDFFAEKNAEAQMDELFLGRGELSDDLQLLRPVDERGALDAAPAVDVLELNDYDDRRAMIMNTLRRDDTADYVDVLREALANDDQETSHYASVVIMDLQQQVHARLAELGRLLEDDPDDLDALGALEQELYQVIKEGVVDENSLPRYVERYWEVSDRLLEEGRPSAAHLHHRIAVDLKAGSGEHARLAARRYLEVHPDDEEAVLDAIRVCVQLNDRAGLDALLDHLGDMPVVLTNKSLRYIRFLRG